MPFTAYFDTKTFLPGTQDTAEVTESVLALEHCDSFLDKFQQCWTVTQIRPSDRRGQYIAEGTGLFQWKEGPWKADSCRPTSDTVIKFAFAGMGFSIISVAIFQPHIQGPFRHDDLHAKIRTYWNTGLNALSGHVVIFRDEIDRLFHGTSVVSDRSDAHSTVQLTQQLNLL